MGPNGDGVGIPGWFIFLFVLAIVLSIGTYVWRISTARRIARDAGMDPGQATRVTMLSNDGVDATYLASAITSSNRQAASAPKSVEERLQDLATLKDKGVVTAEEYDRQRQKILDSM